MTSMTNDVVCQASTAISVGIAVADEIAQSMRGTPTRPSTQLMMP